MKLIVGLGNPGEKYARHRHNVGFMALERIAQRHNIGPWRKRFQGLTAEGQIGGARVMLLMPQTFMNESGQSVGEAQRYLKIAEGDIIVIHDEIDLAPGKLKVKIGGGNAGHNGLRSISAHVGNDYMRVRIGVGHPGTKEAVIGYVLHDFSKADQDWLVPMLDAVADAAGRLAAGDDARFQTEVARRLQQHVPEAKREAKPQRSRRGAVAEGDQPVDDAPPAPKAAVASKSLKAANTREAHRQGALAENLKRWMRGKTSE
ncbi:MAG TPA: aminoacyl-tRNA hydrolase [Hyphomicrobiaceae bacterium]|nr:aminoacyl-tRNA hydrolase [Hyphomicrobiaceae bacterium]